MTVDQTFNEDRPQHAASTSAALASAALASEEGRRCEPLPGRAEHRPQDRNGADPPIPWVPPPGSTAGLSGWPRVYPGL
jgi:hypothetical protein